MAANDGEVSGLSRKTTISGETKVDLQEIVQILIRDPELIRNRRFYYSLLTPGADIYQLEMNYFLGKMDEYEFFHDILTHWVSTHGPRATVGRLYTALVSEQFNFVAESLSRKYPDLSSTSVQLTATSKQSVTNNSEDNKPISFQLYEPFDKTMESRDSITDPVGNQPGPHPVASKNARFSMYFMTDWIVLLLAIVFDIFKIVRGTLRYFDNRPHELLGHNLFVSRDIMNSNTSQDAFIILSNKNSSLGQQIEQALNDQEAKYRIAGKRVIMWFECTAERIRIFATNVGHLKWRVRIDNPPMKSYANRYDEDVRQMPADDLNHYNAGYQRHWNGTSDVRKNGHPELIIIDSACGSNVYDIKDKVGNTAELIRYKATQTRKSYKPTFTKDENEASANDNNCHGSKVAITALQIGPKTLKIHFLNVEDTKRKRETVDDAKPCYGKLFDAFYYAERDLKHVPVINCSVGFDIDYGLSARQLFSKFWDRVTHSEPDGCNSNQKECFHRSFRRLANQNQIVVLAAGNDKQPRVNDLANSPYCIQVGAHGNSKEDHKILGLSDGWCSATVTALAYFEMGKGTSFAAPRVSTIIAMAEFLYRFPNGNHSPPLLDLAKQHINQTNEQQECPCWQLFRFYGRILWCRCNAKKRFDGFKFLQSFETYHQYSKSNHITKEEGVIEKKES